jgi:formylglycine-generating enzyme required for sulfatase activity
MKVNSQIMFLLTLLALLIAGCSKVDSAYKEAKSADSLDAYQSFIKGFPDDPRVPEIKIRIEEKLWTNVLAKRSLDAVSMYVTNYADGKFLKEAKQLREQIASVGMVLIPTGPFTMGTPREAVRDSATQPISVTVSEFYMDTNLISYSQWQSVYNWATNNGYAFEHAGSGKAPNHPVQTVDWFDAVKWCNARSQQVGLVPVYYADIALTHVFTNGEAPAYPNWAASGYRLPTEAEWEKAARGGLADKRFPWGDTISESQANYYGAPAGGGAAFTIDIGASGQSLFSYDYDSGPKGYNAAFATGQEPYTNPVGYFAPNGYRLYDMAGNVFEWCWDWYVEFYEGGTDPRGPASGRSRVLRGGAWNSRAARARCATRVADSPSVAEKNIGFRCVRGN